MTASPSDEQGVGPTPSSQPPGPSVPPFGWSGPVDPQPGIRYDVPQDQKTLALVSTLGMLFVGFLSPLLVYVFTSGDPARRFANDHAKEGLNFSIAFWIGMVISFVLMLVLIGFLTMLAIGIWGLWVIIAGAIQANNGEAPHYPLVPKILK